MATRRQANVSFAFTPRSPPYRRFLTSVDCLLLRASVHSGRYSIKRLLQLAIIIEARVKRLLYNDLPIHIGI